MAKTEKEKQYAREYYRKNRERILAYGKQWRAENPEYHKEYFKNNKDKARDASRRHYYRRRDPLTGHREIFRKRLSHKERRLAAIRKIGGRCQKCGYADDIRALQFDHRTPLLRRINGLSNRLYGGDTSVREILRMSRPTEKYQLLCANCHAIKSYEEKTKFGSDWAKALPVVPSDGNQDDALCEQLDLLTL